MRCPIREAVLRIRRRRRPLRLLEDGLRLRIGISSCLLGEQVRWDGGHKQDRYITGTLGDHFEWVPVCPELEVGMGIPREPVRLTGSGDSPRMLGVSSGRDWTAA